MQALPAAKPWEIDPQVVPMPWRTDICSAATDGKKLTIGFVVDDGVVKPQPPVARAVMEVVHALRSAGHDGMTPRPRCQVNH